MGTGSDGFTTIHTVPGNLPNILARVKRRTLQGPGPLTPVRLILFANDRNLRLPSFPDDVLGVRQYYTRV